MTTWAMARAAASVRATSNGRVHFGEDVEIVAAIMSDSMVTTLIWVGYP